MHTLNCYLFDDGFTAYFFEDMKDHIRVAPGEIVTFPESWGRPLQINSKRINTSYKRWASNSRSTLGQLCINISDGQAVITNDDRIEFHDPIPISDLEYVIIEAKNFIAYRNFRKLLNLFDEFPEVSDVPHIVLQEKTMEQLVEKFPEEPTSETDSDNLIDDSKQDVALVSTWGIQCGIATYTKYLYDAIKKVDAQFPLGIHPISEGIDDVRGRIVHYQHEYGIIPKVPRSRSKVIITFHSVPQDIGSTLAAYEKQLNVVAYVAHFQESKDIISAGTEKDVWLIPHGSKIIPGANDPAVKEYFRKLIDIPELPCAFMFGFQSDNKNYAMVTQACEKAGIKLIISGAVNDHVNYKGNIGCGRDNIVLGRFLSETEVDLYALASDILLFQTNPLEHYSCSGALHRVIGAGRPVICNRVNHYSDLIEGHDCLKFDGEEELVQKILEVEQKEELGRKALEYAEKTSWEIVAKKHMEMYQKYGEF